MARSAEQPENGWLAMWEASTPGLLSSGSEPQGCGPPPAVVPEGDAGVSFTGLSVLLLVGTVLAGTWLGTMFAGILWSVGTLGGALGGAVPARVELMGNLDGIGLVGTLAGIVPGGFELVGNLEGTKLLPTLEGDVLAVIELVGAPAPLEQMAASPCSWAPPAKTTPVEEEDMPVDGTNTEGPGKRLGLGVERARGWKETVGDTGPRGDGRLETMPRNGVCPCSSFWADLMTCSGPQNEAGGTLPF